MKTKIKELMYEVHGIPLSEETLNYIFSKIKNPEKLNYYDLSEEVFNQYREYLLCLFDSFVQQLNTDDVDLANKLNNMCEATEISDEEFEILYNNVAKYEEAIFEYIKENIKEFEDDIIENVIQINRDIATFKDLYDTDIESGLYNCDCLYLKAIGHVLYDDENHFVN